MTQTYAYPEVLVSTDYVAQRLGDLDHRVIEVDVDTKAFDEGHIPGAIGWNWQTQLSDIVQRDIVRKEDMEKLMSESGISNESTVILYGDNSNWFAAWAFWQLKIYGHKDVRIMDGGRKKWLAEGLEISKEVPAIKSTRYRAAAADNSLRAFLPEVQLAVGNGVALVDVRSADEFTGKILSPPGLPETCQRGGHIPGAKNIPWGLACNEDGTIKGYDELQDLYGNRGVTPEKEVIAYCRIGERSSHSWFVLKYLLCYAKVKNYDGSWTEWGNLVGAPVERGA